MANETIIINDDLRTMQIPSSIVLLGVESDDDVNKIPFQMPKEYCGFDLSTFQARINYMNANGTGDIYIVDDLAVDGDDPSLMNFTWLVGRNACAYEGNTKFIVCLKKFDDDQNVVQEFNTTVYSLPVLEGLETTEAVVQQNPDIIEEILQKINDAGIIDLSDYYTKEQVDALKLPNPNALTINGTSYDGSSAVELEIEGGSSQTTEIASGTILHVTDAVAAEPVKSLLLYDASGDEINSANVAIANKNLFRIDQLAQQTVSKGITFEKNADGSIHATGTSTGTYAATQAAIDTGAFVVGETYTISSGKTSGILYVQLILNYTDGTTDYLVSSNQPYTFTLAKEVSSVTGSVQITASGVTVDEWIYPMIEVSDSASAFTNNFYTSMTYDGSLMPVLPDSISNLWSNDSNVNNIVMEYWNDPVMAKVNELEKQFYQTVEHDDILKADSEKAVQNKVVTAALAAKINYPTSGAIGQVLAKTENGAIWSNAGVPTDEQATSAINAWLNTHPEATTTVEDGSISVEKLASDTIALIGNSTLTENFKQALLNIFQHVTFVDEHGQDYYDALENALYPPANLTSISVVFNQGQNVIYDTDSLDVLKQYLIVTAHYDDSTTEIIESNMYTLSGTLSTGISTITVAYGNKVKTFNVTVTHAVQRYTITNNLTNVTNTNNTTSINENLNYNAALTVANGYLMNSVSVKMGGVDITATAYDSSNNTINIASVTGNIVITAEAIEDVGYISGVPYSFEIIEGYTVDTSNFEIVESANNAYVKLPCKNVDYIERYWSTFGGSGRIDFYDNDDNHVKGDVFANNGTHGVTVSHDHDIAYVILSGEIGRMRNLTVTPYVYPKLGERTVWNANAIYAPEETFTNGESGYLFVYGANTISIASGYATGNTRGNFQFYDQNKTLLSKTNNMDIIGGTGIWRTPVEIPSGTYYIKIQVFAEYNAMQANYNPRIVLDRVVE